MDTHTLTTVKAFSTSLQSTEFSYNNIIISHTSLAWPDQFLPFYLTTKKRKKAVWPRETNHIQYYSTVRLLLTLIKKLILCLKSSFCSFINWWDTFTSLNSPSNFSFNPVTMTTHNNNKLLAIPVVPRSTDNWSSNLTFSFKWDCELLSKWTIWS